MKFSKSRKPFAGGISRRQLIRSAALGAAYAAGAALVRPARAGAQWHRGRRSTVAVFGGGIAGLTAAHELAERGFEVTVYERRAWGGKARSTEVAGTGVAGRKPLPGEHGFRVTFGCYQNLPDIMRRIPFGSNSNGVFDNLVAAPQVAVSRSETHTLTFPLGGFALWSYRPDQVVDLILGVLIDMEIPPLAAAHLARRLAVFCSSCDARRLGQWEKTSWTEFIGGDRYGREYENFFRRLPEFTQGSPANESSAKFMAWVIEIFVVYALLGRGTNGPAFRVLNAPTNEAWIDPWIAELQRLGIGARLGYSLERLTMSGGQITGALARGPEGPETVVADWYVCALPVERARLLWDEPVLAADRKLAEMSNLRVAPAAGLMLYLRESSRIAKGIIVCADSPWALSVLPQSQFWATDFASTYGDGTVRDKLSVIIALWSNPGILFGKPVSECTPSEVAAEVWAQVKQHVNDPGRAPALTDDMLHSWDLDPGVFPENGRLVSEDPLVLPTLATEQYRPDVTTGIPNLMLCGDYLSGKWEVANMESACFSGRRAANAVLDAAGSREPRVRTIDPYQPPEWEPLRRIDESLYRVGLPNLLDVGPR